MTLWSLWVAAAVATFICAVHAIAGAKDTATPISKSRDLDLTAKHTALLVWHLMTVALAQLAALFAAAAWWNNWTLALVATLFSVTFAATGVIYPLIAKVPFNILPQASMFLALVFLGTLAVTS